MGVPDQLIDYTWGREHTIYDGTDSVVEHVDLTQPFTASLRKSLLQAARAAGIDCHDGGVYAATQGPRLETAAEVDRLERDGADYIGMTAMPEASLARELDVNSDSVTRASRWSSTGQPVGAIGLYTRMLKPVRCRLEL